MTTTDIAHKDRAHSYVGGSTAKRVMNCPGSVNLCAQYPNVETVFAAEGTALHEAIDLIFQGLLKNDRDVIGLDFNGFVITEDMFEQAIVPALAMWDALDAELGGINYYNERRVVFPGIDGAFGTVDMVGTSKDRTVVWDWKFGRGVAVTAEKNEQLMYYAYAAAHTQPTDRFFDYDKPIELFICQPMISNGERFTRWTTSWAQLEVFALELRHAVERSQEPDPPFKTGSWCRFCNAKTGCPAYRGMVDQVATLSPAQMQSEIERWLPYADMMIEWGQAVKDTAHRHLEEGGSIDGWKLVQKRATRRWVDEEAADRFMQEAGVPPEQRSVNTVISPAEAEKVLKRLKAGEIPDSLVSKISSGTTLVTAGDKRPAVETSVTALQRLADGLAAM
jgi:hypothetical protein